MEFFSNFLSDLSNIVWGPAMLIFLIGTHIFLTFRLGIIQRYIFKGIKLSFQTHKEGKGDISHFASLMTAMAATVGTGNIVGVSTAIAAGGPGAVLWMWLTGVFGIATKYSEALLSVKYRITNEKGFMSGGPMYVLEKGMNAKWLAILFAVFTAIAAFGIGNTVQANSISALIHDTFDVSPWITGIIITILTAAVMIGGVRSIAKCCEILVPFMVVFFIIGCLIILVMTYKTIPDTIFLIFKSAFTGQAAVGGFAGATIKEAMRFGMARGLFSNESGMGSAPIIAAAAQTKEPVRQALVSSTGTFWDTVILCAITGILIVNAGFWRQGCNGVLLTKETFTHIGAIGPIVLGIALATFVFSTILGWSYYGEKAVEYLFGTKAIYPYRWLWVIAVFVGSVITMPMVWSFADIANALMAIPNLISLWVLNGIIVSETKKYFTAHFPLTVNR